MDKIEDIKISIHIDSAGLAAQITELITKKVIVSEPHYVTKSQCITHLGWSAHQLKEGEKDKFLKPLRLAGKGEIRYSFTELTNYHNQLQNNGINIQLNHNTKRGSSSRNASTGSKRSRS